MPDILGFTLAPEADDCWVVNTRLKFNSAAAAAAFLSDLAGAPRVVNLSIQQQQQHIGDVTVTATEAKVVAAPEPVKQPEAPKPKATKPAQVKVAEPAPAPEPPAVVEAAPAAAAPEPEAAPPEPVVEAAVEDEPEPEPDRAKPVRQPKPAGPDPQAVIDGLPEASFAGRLRPIALALKVAGVTAEQAEAVMLVEDNRKRMKSYADRADYPSIVAATVSAAWAASA